MRVLITIARTDALGREVSDSMMQAFLFSLIDNPRLTAIIGTRMSIFQARHLLSESWLILRPFSPMVVKRMTAVKGVT